MWARVSIVLSWRLADQRIQCTDLWTLWDTHSSSFTERLLRNSKTSRCRFTGIRNCPACHLTSALIGEKYRRRMISLLHRDGWKILTSRCCFAGITQGQDQNYWQQVDSGQWDGGPVWTERGVGKLLSTIPDISGENDGRLIDCYKGRDRRWVKDREVWDAYTEKKQEAKLRSRFPFDFC